MILGLCLFSVAVLGWAVVATVTKKADQGTRERGVARRFRQIRRHPEQVNLLDVENLLIADSIPRITARRIMRKAGSRRIGARTMWRWAAAYGSDKVVLAISADLTEDTLLDHLDAGTSPDWPEVGGLADHHAGRAVLPMCDLTCPDDISSLDDISSMNGAIEGVGDMRRFVSLPPIANPGLAPFVPVDVWENPDGDQDLPKAA